MSLFNANWIGFDGTPITGKVPTQMVVHADAGKQLSQQQYGAVIHAYKLFCDAIQVSAFPLGYHVQNRVLQDGTQVRMTSNNAVHSVYVVPSGGVQNEWEIPHGFAVSSNWGSPCIYGLNAAENTWTVHRSKGVPQVGADGNGVTGYNQAVRAKYGEVEGVVLPMVFNREKRELWDYAPHSAASVEGDYIVPCNLQYTADSGIVFNVHKPHFLLNHTVRSIKGDTLYTMALPDALLAEPEPVTPLPGNSDSKGVSAAVQVYRRAIISPTTGVTAFRFCNETLTRSSENGYVASARHVVTVFTPISSGVSTVTNGVFSSLGEDMSGSIDAVEFYRFAAVSYDNNEGAGLPSDYRSGMAGCEYRTYNFDSAATVTEVAFRKEVETAPASAVEIENIVALAAESGVSFAQLSIDVAYPRTEYWRGGIKSRAVNLSSAFGASATWYYGSGNKALDRRDAVVEINGDPAATLHLTWQDLKVFEGSVNGTLSGKYHKDTTTEEKFDDGMFGYSFFVAGPFYTLFLGPSQKAYYTSQPNLAPEWQAEMAAAPSSGTHVTVLKDEPLVNEGSYTLTSRYIIDYDHRAHFSAAIRVEVVCSGARWVQGEASYRGALRVDVNPSYVVNIYFESNWNGASAQKLLHTETCTRPGFEFTRVFAPKNIFVHPADDATVPMAYFEPPQPQLPPAVIDQLANLAKHQGVNTHLAAQDIRTDLAEGPMPSAKGIEFSYLRRSGNGLTEIPHTKFAVGQLYARTFTLSSLFGSLWLLTELKMNAPLNNVYPEDGSASMWHYLPGLKTIIESNTKFHVEVRNGVLVSWSNDIPSKTGDPVPAPADRTINLYQV